MGTIVNFVLLMCGVFAFTAGLYYFRGEKNNPVLSRSMLIMGAMVFFWCGGYALMGFAENENLVYLGRNIGFLGVLGFLFSENVFVIKESKSFQKCRMPVYIILFIITLADAIIYSRMGKYSYVRIDARTCYYGFPSIARNFHSLYLMVILICMCAMGIRWLRSCKLKRDRRLVLHLFAANLIVLLFAIPELLLPLTGKPSFPTQAFGGFIAFMYWWYFISNFNAFRISLPQLSTYIYNNVHTAMLVYNHEYKLVLANDYACRELNINVEKNKKLSDVFEIEENDARLMFESINPEVKKVFYKLKTRETQDLCSLNFSVICDRYKDVYCYICFVYDLADEIATLNHANRIKGELEASLQGKTKQVEHLTLQSITTIANTIDAKDNYTKGHSSRVAEYSAMLAAKLGWTDSEIQNLKYIALLHDIGKIGIPDSVLNKPGKLTSDEYDLIKSHTLVGGDILKDISVIKDLSAGAKYHHEKFDGNGYPYGMKGKEIPIIARIIGIADAYDAMNSKRVYRLNLSRRDIRQQLIEGRGTQFDPDLLDIFVEMFDKNELSLEMDYDSQMQIMVDESSRLLSQIMANMEEEWKKESETDYITGLLNRKAGEERTTIAMRGHEGCLAIIDLDNLKTINDTFGHLTGDHAIRIVGEILKAHSEHCIAARIGGDEFLYYMENVSEAEATVLINGVIQAFKNRREKISELEVASLSAGLCMTTITDDYKNIYQKADKALYLVKQNGKDGYSFYNVRGGDEERSEQVDLKRIAESILRQGKYDGTLGLEYREFTKLCSFINNMAARYQHNIQLLMVTLEMEKGEIFDVSAREEAMSCVENAIKKSLRNVDVSTRFSSEQFLIILTNATKESITIINNRIMDQFYKNYTKQGITLRHDVIDLYTFEGKES